MFHFVKRKVQIWENRLNFVLYARVTKKRQAFSWSFGRKYYWKIKAFSFNWNKTMQKKRRRKNHAFPTTSLIRWWCILCSRVVDRNSVQKFTMCLKTHKWKWSTRIIYFGHNCAKITKFTQRDAKTCFATNTILVRDPTARAVEAETGTAEEMREAERAVLGTVGVRVDPPPAFRKSDNLSSTIL